MPTFENTYSSLRSPPFVEVVNAFPYFTNWFNWTDPNNNPPVIVGVNQVISQDLNGDGADEIIIFLEKSYTNSESSLPARSKVVILSLKSDGNFHDITSDIVIGQNSIAGQISCSPVIADVNQDGKNDFVFSFNQDDGRIVNPDYTTTGGVGAFISDSVGGYQLYTLPMQQGFWQDVSIGTDGNGVPFIFGGGSGLNMDIYKNPVYQFINGDLSFRSIEGLIPNIDPMHSLFLSKDGVASDRLVTVDQFHMSQLNGYLKNIDGTWDLTGTLLPDFQVVGSVNYLTDTSHQGYTPCDVIQIGDKYFKSPDQASGEAGLIGSLKITPNADDVVLVKIGLDEIINFSDGASIGVQDTIRGMGIFAVNFDAAGNFYKGDEFIFLEQNVNITSCEIIDINKDGYQDIVLNQQLIGGVSNLAPYLLLNNQDGTFSKSEYSSVVSVFPSYSNPLSTTTVGDFNGDGIYDIAMVLSNPIPKNDGIEYTDGFFKYFQGIDFPALDYSATYQISATPESINEGATATYTVTTTNVVSGTQLAYTLSGAGITSGDVVGGQLSGVATVEANGTATFMVNLVADQFTESVETLTVTVQGQSTSVTVNDTSTTPIVAGRTKYFVLPSSTGANFIDFDLSYGSVTLTGEQVIFVGSTAVDAVFVRPGVTVDFTLSGSSADKIYLGGNFASYTASITGSVMNLQRGSGGTLEAVSFIKSTSAASSDSVIFADGTLNSLDLYNNLKTATPLPALSTTETSIAPLAPALAGSELNASIKAFALNAAGDRFAPAHPGVAMTVVGSVGVDTVYVPRGGVVDCTLLGSGQDAIYFTGNWGDYTKAIAGSVVTFSRSVDGYSESVRVVGNPANVSLNDQLVFADGAVHSGDAKTALSVSLTTALSAVTGYDPTLITPGLAPAFSDSAFNSVTNLEVGSNLMLNYRESVTAVSGKYIHIVNDGGTGFRGESTVSTFNILVTDTTQVSISGGRVTLNPTADLDLSNNYHITIDAGAFTGVSSHQASAAYDGTNTLHFSTVKPGTAALANAVASQVMNADGTLGSGHLWLDIEGIGSPSAPSGTALDLAANHYALVAKDYNAAGGSPGDDGVTTGDFYVAANNFGTGDLIYIDNQGGTANDMSQTHIIAHGSPPTTVQFAGTGLEGMVDISLAATVATFATIAQMKTLLGTSTSPVISA